MDDEERKENPSPETKCRWSSYGNYKCILWAWMMNENTVMFTPAEVSLVGFYIHSALQVISVVFIGIPLLYSEICIAQYTNSNIITMWDFFPVFRYVGFGTLYLIILKTIYLLVLTSWYLEYTFFSAIDPPPWYSCADFNDTKCMVKSVNVSVFQHCLEAESQFADDCGMKTASNCFFEREIGGNNTADSLNCLLPWKTVIASTTICLLLFLLSIRREKFIQIFVKLLAAYVCIMILVLCCIALSKSGTWYATNVAMDLNVSFHNAMYSFKRGILTVGSGCGIVLFLSRDAPFRSPATMTSISISLFTIFLSFLLTLIAFSGIKTMIYFHGEELNVVEIGSTVFFLPFACITEIMNYFDAVPFRSFAWFSALLFCLFSNLWILLLFLVDLLLEMELARKYKNFGTAIILIITNIVSWPFFCSDLTGVLTDATEIMQVTNSLLFSFSLYWMYGFKNHNIDITFMIGIKASYFWKLCWLASPLLHASILFGRWDELQVMKYKRSYYIEALDMHCDVLLLYIILAIYHAIIFFGIIIQIYLYYRQGEIREIFSPSLGWGPRDKILYKSRKLFVPEIMTTEFLYRQVRVRGYGQRKRYEKKLAKPTFNESSIDGVEWSALTSN